MISSVTRLGATALLASVLLSSAMPASAARCIRDMTFGSGKDRYDRPALYNAIMDWRARARSAYGPIYSFWENALNPGKRCEYTGGFTYCRVWGQSCQRPPCVSCQPKAG